VGYVDSFFRPGQIASGVTILTYVELSPKSMLGAI